MKKRTSSRPFGWGYLLFALLFFLLGVCLIAFENALDRAALAVGICLCLFSVVYAVMTLSEDGRGAAFFFRISFAVIGLIAGVVTIVTRAGAIEVIVSVIAALSVIDGSFKLQTAILARKSHSSLWTALLALSVTVILGGLYLLKFYPADHPRAVALATAFVLLIEGAVNLLTPFFLSAIQKEEDARQAEEIQAAADAASVPDDPPAVEAPEKKRRLFRKKQK